MRKVLLLGLALGLLLGGRPSAADVWDLDTINDEDDDTGTDNELTHGSVQVHDLAAEAGIVDQDWYRFNDQPYSSYEFIAEGLTGDVFNVSLLVDLVALDGTTVEATGQSLPGGIGSTRTLRWVNATAGAVDHFVRVDGAGTSCTTACTTVDQYTVRFFETTASVARFNNAGSQVTSLLLQNTADYVVTGTVAYWSGAGVLVTTQPINLGPKQLLNTNTSLLTGPVGGSITIAHDGRLGDLQGKAVALEPSTGFTFDTPLVYKSH